MATLEETLPSSWYLDEAIFKLEKKEIFFREWLCVAREEQVPNPADSLVLEIMGESIILLRNHVHELRAFYNVCRHRGARLCAAKKSDEEEEEIILRGGISRNGNIVCPYHAWTGSWCGLHI